MTKTWKEIQSDLLEVLPNSAGSTEIKIDVPEVTFLGVKNQPDFAELRITLYPDEGILELRSLKLYVYQLRDIVVSYERLIDIVYQQLMDVLKPNRLRVVLITKPRGGISSRLTIDSDWSARGGKEEFDDWKGNVETAW
jgi:7-cyano-7-deazaguanine reductase